MDVGDTVDDMRHKPLRRRERLLNDAGIPRVIRSSNLLRQRVGVSQVREADAGSRDAVYVRGSDPASGRAERARARSFVRCVPYDVIRKDHVGTIGDLDARNVNAECRQGVELVDQRPQVDDGAPADEELDVRMHHARGNDPQCELTLADDDRMPRVVAAGKARDHIVIRGVKIDDPAFAFVAPLQPDDQIGF